MRSNRLLWTIQVLLAVLFLFAGGVKLVLPSEALAGPISLPIWFLRFIGVAEVAGALGLILPGLLRIRTGLTPLAALGLVVIMIGATGLTVIALPVAQAVVPALAGMCAAVVARGRWRFPIRHAEPRPVLC